MSAGLTEARTPLRIAGRQANLPIIFGQHTDFLHHTPGVLNKTRGLLRLSRRRGCQTVEVGQAELIRLGLFVAAGGILLADGQSAKPADSRALAAWSRTESVLVNPRCLNCHQANVPLQGDIRRMRIPLVVRGPDNHGVGAMRCGNCDNGFANNDTSDTPGAGPPGSR
jgi:hypothetical protein